MKKLLLLFIASMPFLLMGQMLTLNFTGNVQNNAGQPIQNHAVVIAADSSSGLNFQVVVYTDPSGNYNATGTFGFMPSQAVFTATTSNCNGALATNYIYWSPAGLSGVPSNFVVACGANTNVCGAAFTINTSGLTASFTNNSFSSFSGVPFTSNWTFGDGGTSTATNPLHTYSSSGVYLIGLTITDTLGCTSTQYDSVYVTSGGGGNGCQAGFSYSPSAINPSVVTFTSTSVGSVPGTALTYNWSPAQYFVNNNIANPTVQFPAVGSYTVCLTISDITGCTSTYCDSVYVSNGSTTVNTIQGYVYGDSMNMNSDSYKVYLIQHDSLLGTLTAVDSLPLVYSAYQFTNVAPGNYLVKAALNVGSASYANYLPTYYDASLFWSSASYIASPSQAGLYHNIFMINGVNPGGPGFIGGLVSQGANRTSTPGDPMSNVEIMLLDMNDNPIAYTYSDANGMFEFPSVAYGTYKVWAEMWGRVTTPEVVTISPNQTTVSGISIQVNSTYVTSSIDANSFFNTISGAYPNPVSDKANVNVSLKKGAIVNMELQDAMGKSLEIQTLDLQAGNHTLSASLKGMATGIYFIRLSIDGETMQVRKVVKE